MRKQTLEIAIEPPADLVERDPEFLASWAAFAEMRLKIKKPLTQSAANRIFGILKKSTAVPSVVLDASTISEWAGVFPERYEAKRFVEPTYAELKAHAEEKGYPIESVNKFCAHFRSTGWKMKNGLQMMDWKSGILKWCMNENRQAI